MFFLPMVAIDIEHCFEEPTGGPAVMGKSRSTSVYATVLRKIDSWVSRAEPVVLLTVDDCGLRMACVIDTDRQLAFITRTIFNRLEVSDPVDESDCCVYDCCINMVWGCRTRRAGA